MVLRAWMVGLIGLVGWLWVEFGLLVWLLCCWSLVRLVGWFVYCWVAVVGLTVGWLWLAVWLVGLVW